MYMSQIKPKPICYWDGPKMTVKLISLHVAKALSLRHYLPEADLFSYISEH